MRILLTGIAFLIASAFWMLWQEVVPPGGLTWAIGVMIALGMVYGTWDWSKRFDSSRKDGD